MNGGRYVPLLMERRPWVIEPAERQPGAAQAVSLIESLFGKKRKMDASERLVTNPECYQ